MSFTPRFAIVTASDSGIGESTAIALAEAGLDVGITWHSDADGARQTAAAVHKRGQRAVVTRFDATDLEHAGEVIDGLADDLGGLDVFVNNAGGGAGGSILNIGLDYWRSVVALNLDGAFVGMQRAAIRMVRAGRGGRIIAVSSVHEHQPMIGMAPYDAAKHGLGGLVKSMALELAPKAITVNAVAPGEIATPINDAEDVDPHEIHRPGIPIGRPGDAREVAALIAFLASPAASYITGASVVVDGGMLQMGPQAGAAIASDDWRSA